MPYKGHVKNGVIVIEEPVDIPEGTEVSIEVAGGDGPTLAERLASVIGTAKALPDDAAENLDHYLYGTPKK
jgi:predicted DNA-binding antitoxin AbrB/MazE fold protein